MLLGCMKVHEKIRPLLLCSMGKRAIIFDSAREYNTTHLVLSLVSAAVISLGAHKCWCGASRPANKCLPCKNAAACFVAQLRN